MRRVFLHCNRILGTLPADWRNLVAIPLQCTSCTEDEPARDAQRLARRAIAPTSTRRRATRR
jgi:hypothetical protein